MDVSRMAANHRIVAVAEQIDNAAVQFGVQIDYFERVFLCNARQPFGQFACVGPSSLVIVVAQGGHEKQRKQNCNYQGDNQRTSGRRKIWVRQARIEVLSIKGFQRAPTFFDGETTAVV
jgi:hypothetical protein